MLQEETPGRQKGGEVQLLALFDGPGSFPLLPQSDYFFMFVSAGASSHLTVPIYDLCTAFTGADSHPVLLMPHRSFLSVK